jgi:hypothetical protein
VLNGAFAFSQGSDNQINFAISRLVIDNMGSIDARANIPDGGDFPNSPIGQAWVSFSDGGLTLRVINMFAVNMGIPADETKTRIVNGLNRRVQSYDPNSPERRALTQLYRYFDTPGIHNFSRMSINYNGGGVSSNFDSGNMTVEMLMPPNYSGWRDLLTWFIKLPIELVAN